MLLQLLEAFLIRWNSYVECSVLKVNLEAFVGMIYASGSTWGPCTAWVSMNVFYIRGFLKPKSNQENPLGFIRPFQPLFSLIAPQL